MQELVSLPADCVHHHCECPAHYGIRRALRAAGLLGALPLTLKQSLISDTGRVADHMRNPEQLLVAVSSCGKGNKTLCLHDSLA